MGSDHGNYRMERDGADQPGVSSRSFARAPKFARDDAELELARELEVEVEASVAALAKL